MSTGNALSRDNALDALRGLAILGMVLSGSLAFGDVLAGWMFHAQVPPPLHKFVPTRAGITWVDLVFPFFLFAMGAAIPLSMRAVAHTGSALWHAVRRFAWLLFFALFTHHMKAAVLGDPGSPVTNLLSLAGFGLLCVVLLRSSPWWLKGTGLIACAFLLWTLPFHDASGFSWTRSDIILVVLANMALVGGMVWWFTRRDPLLRMALLPLLAAILLSGKVGDSWNHALLNTTPAPWAYQFYYLKYLFIVLPGTVAGEWLRDARKVPAVGSAAATATAGSAAFWAAMLIVVNVALLYSRELRINLALTLAMVLLLWVSVRNASALDRRFAKAGIFALLLGLALEALEGGIRKDSSTFSYYGVTTGLAFLSLLVLRYLGAHRLCARAIEFLAYQGRNPLLAYVAGGLLVMPLMRLTELYPLWAGLDWHWTVGTLKGLLFTALVGAVTWWTVRRGWLWKI
ncbi:MAG: DUF5009 domain-containing protein [Rhodoferax sp.]|nr:DUF5009 domain-containing protein [Rhodoferax sp.]